MGTPVEGQESGNEVPNSTVQGEITPDATPGPNPNWEPVLNLLPESFHSVVTPHFQQWDQAANTRIESIKGQYKDFEPFIEHGIGRDDLESGIRLVNLLNENPQALYDALAQSLGTQQQTTPAGEVDPTEVPAEETNLPPGYDKLQQGVEFMAQRMLDAENRQKEAEASAKLDQELKAATEKYGPLNEKLFLPYLSKVISDNPKATLDQAAANFVELQNEIIKSAQAAQPYAPNLLGTTSGGGAGLPSKAIDPRQLNDTETKALVVEMLRAQAAGRQP